MSDKIVANPKRMNAIMSHFDKATREPCENLKFAMKSDNEPDVWFLLFENIAGNEDEYKGGQYLMRMEFPIDYPWGPPQFWFMTPQGLCEINKISCISIGEFHKKDYLPVLGAIGFARQIISGIVGWREIGDGINLIKTTVEQKKMFARVSAKYNAKKHPEIIKLINDSFENYSQKWKSLDKSKCTMSPLRNLSKDLSKDLPKI